MKKIFFCSMFIIIAMAANAQVRKATRDTIYCVREYKSESGNHQLYSEKAKNRFGNGTILFDSIIRSYVIVSQGQVIENGFLRAGEVREVEDRESIGLVPVVWIMFPAALVPEPWNIRKGSPDGIYVREYKKIFRVQERSIAIIEL